MLDWSREIRIGAGALVLLFGMSRLVLPRHPRWLARIRPTQLALWSFLMASAHGAALMLLPIPLGLCVEWASVQQARAGGKSLAWPPVVSGPAHRRDGGGRRRRGLGRLSLRSALQVLRGWLNLEVVWGASLVVAGAASIALAWPAMVV